MSCLDLRVIRVIMRVAMMEKKKEERRQRGAEGDSQEHGKTKKTKDRLDATFRAQLEEDIKTAYYRELSKMPAFDHILHKDRQPIVEALTSLVIKEVQEQYFESDLQLPDSAKGFLGSVTQSRVKVLVMQVPFVSDIEKKKETDVDKNSEVCLP